MNNIFKRISGRSGIAVLFTIYLLFGIADAQIALNQVGYRPYDNKVAMVFGVNFPGGTDFNIKDSSGNQVKYSGVVGSQPYYDTASKETVYYLDFTDFNVTGSYYIEIPAVNETSSSFEISNTIYRNVLSAAMKSYYYQRSGQELPAQYAGVFARPASYMNDALIHPSAISAGVPSGTYIENKGGWFDSGDYGKKIVNAGFALGVLLNGYEIASQNYNNLKLNIPEIEGMPDFLTEIKYELDWMLKMQRNDGGVYHLITAPQFPTFSVMPHQDTQTRYIVQVSSCATGVFAAVMAKAYLDYKQYDSAYASKLLKAAAQAWLFLANNPEIVPPGGYHDPEGINNTGLYEDDNDRDERFWAACELFRATGETQYNNYVKIHFTDWPYSVVYPANWKDVHNLGMFTYLMTNRPGSDQNIKNSINSSLSSYAQQGISNINSSGFKSALRNEDYYWGSNSIALMYGVDLVMISVVMPNNSYVQNALAQLNYVLGSNALNMSFITMTGNQYPKRPAQILTEADGVLDPIPGFLVGGPNGSLDDPIIKQYQQQYQLPPAKCYLDNYLSYSTNEVSLSWNAPLVFLAGYFVTPVTISPPDIHNAKIPTEMYIEYPNTLELEIRDTLGLDNISTVNIVINNNIDQIISLDLPFSINKDGILASLSGVDSLSHSSYFLNKKGKLSVTIIPSTNYSESSNTIIQVTIANKQKQTSQAVYANIKYYRHPPIHIFEQQSNTGFGNIKNFNKSYVSAPITINYYIKSSSWNISIYTDNKPKINNNDGICLFNFPSISIPVFVTTQDTTTISPTDNFNINNWQRIKDHTSSRTVCLLGGTTDKKDRMFVYLGINPSSNPVRGDYSSQATIKINTDEDQLFIDDFESGNKTNNWGGIWYPVADASSSLLNSTVLSGFQSDHALKISYSFGSGVTRYAFLTCMLSSGMESVKDLSGYSGIEFYLKGNGRSFSCVLEEYPIITSYDNYKYVVDRTPNDWVRYRLHFSDFQQVGWGISVPLNTILSKVRAIELRADSAVPGETGEFWIDNVKFF